MAERSPASRESNDANGNTLALQMKEIEALTSAFTELEESMKGYEMRMMQQSEQSHVAEKDRVFNKIMKEMESFRDESRKFDEALKNFIEKFEFWEFIPASLAESEEGLEKKLTKCLVMRKEIAEEGRQKGYKSIIEFMPMLNQSLLSKKEGKMLYQSAVLERVHLQTLKLVAHTLGSEVSLIIVKYFSCFLMYLSYQEMASKIRIMKSTLQLEQTTVVEGSSRVVMDMLVSVVEFLEREMCSLKWGCYYGRSKKKEAFRGMENDLLGMITFQILSFETAFSAPLFPAWFMTRNVLSGLGNSIQSSILSKLQKISSKLDELEMGSSEGEDRKLKTLKWTLELEIEKIWDKLEFK